MMTPRKMLIIGGTCCFVFALFQGIIGFYPGLSLYFGAPEALVRQPVALIFVSFAIAALVVAFGLYAFSGAGMIRSLPWKRPVLTGISLVFIVRGLLLVPELLVVGGLVQSPIPMAPRFLLFSACALVLGAGLLWATICQWARLAGPRP